MIAIVDWSFSAFILLLFALACVAFFALVYFGFISKETKRVKEESARYHYFADADDCLNYYRLQELYSYCVYLDSKSKIDHLNPEQSIKEYIRQDADLLLIVKKGLFNKQILPEFQKWVESAPAYRSDAPKKLYDRIEREITDSLVDELTPIIPSFEFIFSYTSPAGRNHYEQKYTISIEQIIRFVHDIKRYQEEKTTAQYQRKLMTPALRYNVLRRDNFRCTLCGRKASDGVELEVDHIRPVSKGGRTEMGNLRTLCRDCNRGKRDQYDDTGLN